jgi:hypothetical protein
MKIALIWLLRILIALILVPLIVPAFIAFVLYDKHEDLTKDLNER